MQSLHGYSCRCISIHAPLRERLYYDLPSSFICNFNPRSLAGATSAGLVVPVIRLYFNPRSLAGATKGVRRKRYAYVISIHAPLRERHCVTCFYIFCTVISIHAPLRERRFLSSPVLDLYLFQSTLPCGSDSPLIFCACAKGISIHAPLRERHRSCSAP